MDRDKTSPERKERGSEKDSSSDARQADAGDDLATAPDHDVPNEEVIEKTLPDPGPDASESE